MGTPQQDAGPVAATAGTPAPALPRPSAPTELNAEEVVAVRSGDVLLRHTILKSDHFPGCQNTRLTPLLDGAPNYRQVPSLPVYGVAIPTVSGLRTVLDLMGAAKARRKVVWFNLREEPVLYINGRPFVVREADKPFANLEYTGIDRYRLEDMEARLKADVLSEAASYGGVIMVAHEDDSFQVIEDWEAVTEVDVQTPAEVYAELAKDGYDVDYLRVPITDEKAPKGDDFEALITRCWAPPPGAALIFNCQMGRGRTTTGMAIGCLLALRRARGVVAPPPAEPAESLPEWFVGPPDATGGGAAGMSPRFGSMTSLASAAAGGGSTAGAATEDAELKSGYYAVIRSLLRALENGRDAKVSLDLVLDACAAMQNLREAIASYRSRLFGEPNEIRRQSFLQVCLEYLERYYVLVEFAAYLDDPGFDPGAPGTHVTFAQWRDARPELKGILQRLIRSNPLAALALDRPVEGGGSGSAGALAAAAVAAEAAEEAAEEVLAHRNGSVLGPHTILKQDHFPGCQSGRLPALVPGAPNFRGVAGPAVRVFGGAIATAEGIRRVLETVGAGPDAPDATRTSSVWHIMREEPVIFIAGAPYVLREESRPFKNLLEYRGIDAERLDAMEQRLRKDVLEEAAAEGGRILVTRETTGPMAHAGDTAGGTLRQEYVTVDGAETVATPAQVFEALQAEGYRVTFLRVPITDGTCPRPADFDAFYSAAAAAGPTDALIYTCQLGGGRTTMGMAVGTLLRIHLNGATLPAASEMERRETHDRLDEDVGGRSPRGGSDDEDEGYGGENGHNRPEGHRRHHRHRSSHAVAAQGVLDAAAASLSAFAAASGAADALPLDPEAKNLQEGEYVGMRRFTRTLERGAEAKAEVDAVVDACGTLINLRTSIMRYRKPKSAGRFFRPEIQARHSAFQRGSTYLERYCMLVAFSVYLHQCRQKGRRMTFTEWLAARPDVVAAREALHQNPAGALAPVPVVPPLSLTPGGGWGADGAGGPGPTPVPSTAGKDVPLEEQRRVLLRRKGSTVGRRSILKSFTVAGRLPSIAAPALNASELQVDGVTDMRRAQGFPVFTLGAATVDGLRKLLAALGARPGGSTHVVVTDLREELVLYVNGTAYLRRELEMPAAALHHAGIQAAKLEDLERRLRADMVAEAAAWGGRVLLHREVEAAGNGAAGGGAGGGGGVSGGAKKAGDAPQTSMALDFSFDAAAGGGERRAAVNLESAATAAATGTAGGEDITRTTEYQPTTQVAAFWELTGDVGDIDQGMCTPAEVFVGLAAEGYGISYRRVPLSRERTPQAADLNQLQQQMGNLPGNKSPVYLFLSRTATGSSARFAAAFACAERRGVPELEAAVAAAAAVAAGAPFGASLSGADSPGGGAALDGLSPAAKRARSSAGLLRNDSELSDLVRSAPAGEYRGVMNLCRVLPGGNEAKAAVDEAIDACTAIGNLREDILRCKAASEEENAADPGAAAAARRLGLHYLQRYFYLIAFRAFLAAGGGTRLGAAPVPFSEWVAQRKEITYLLSSLELE